VPILLPRALTMTAANIHQKDVALIAEAAARAAGRIVISVAGQCSAMTRASLQSFIQRRGAEGRAVIRECVKSFQAAHYLGLAENDQSQEIFVYGWMRTRILGLG
jgi:hypothetical protein